MSPANQLAEVPAELKALPNWVWWKLTERDGTLTKPPFIAGTNRYASSINPDTWTDFETAAKNVSLSTAGGIGFVLNGPAREKKLIGFDLDGCRNPETGEVVDWAEDIIEAIDSFAEFTPSGYGIRVWVKGDFVGSENVFELDPSAGFGDKVKIEVYDRDRYFTITGDSYFAEPVDIEKRDLAPVFELIRKIQEKYAPRETPKAQNENGTESSETAGESSSYPIENLNGPVTTTRYVLLTKGTLSGNKPTRIEDDYGNFVIYPDRSAADMALATVSAMKHGDDADAIWNDYAESSLYREKWSKRERDFRKGTIAKGIKSAQRMKSTPLSQATTVSGDTLQWAEPRPFEPLLSPVPPCKLEYLPEAFRDYAQDVAERMSVPLDYVVICMMCSFAAVVGRRAFVYPKANDNSWKEALNLLGAVVAPSGSKKSPAWRHFVNPIVEIEAEWRETFEQQTESHTKQMEVYAQIKKNAKKEKTIPPDPPLAPKPRRRIVFNDATPEKMHAMMEVNPEGLYSFQDEIGGWLAMMDKKGREAERRMFLAAANGDEWFTLDRIERGEVGAWMCSSYFGGMQPFVCQALVNDPRNVGDGTTARFGLLSYPDNTVFTPRIDRKENEAAKIQYAEILREFAPLTVRSISLKFAADAQPMFNDWQNAHDERVLSLPDTVTRSHLSKYNGLVPRLAALYQLVDLAAVSVNTEGVVAGISGLVLIDAAHLSRAIAFVTEYLEPHMNRVYGCIKSSWQLAEASLAEHIKAGDLRAPFTAREIVRKRWSHLKDAESVSFAIETFIEHGWLRQMPTPTGQRGQPAIRYEVNPAAAVSSLA